MEVAIKTLKSASSKYELSDRQVDEFKKEFQIMIRFQSPVLVYFFGATLVTALISFHFKLLFHF